MDYKSGFRRLLLFIVLCSTVGLLGLTSNPPYWLIPALLINAGLLIILGVIELRIYNKKMSDLNERELKLLEDIKMKFNLDNKLLAPVNQMPINNEKHITKIDSSREIINSETRLFASIEDGMNHGWVFENPIGAINGVTIFETASKLGTKWTFAGLRDPNNFVACNFRLFGNLSYELQ